MNRVLVENINNRVAPDDILYHLGDFSWTKDPYEVIKQIEAINCNNIHFIRGNHDWNLDKAIRIYYDKQYRTKNITIQDYLEIKHRGHDVVLFHYPMESWNKSFHGSLHFHGHTHGKANKIRNRLEVGVDCVYNYSPILLDDAIKLASQIP